MPAKQKYLTLFEISINRGCRLGPYHQFIKTILVIKLKKKVFWTSLTKPEKASQISKCFFYFKNNNQEKYKKLEIF